MKDTVLFTKHPSDYTDIIEKAESGCCMVSEEAMLNGQLLKHRPTLLMIDTESIDKKSFVIGELQLEEAVTPPAVVYADLRLLRQILSGENPLADAFSPYEIPEEMNRIFDKVLIQFSFSPSLRGYHYIKQAFYYEYLNSRQISAVKKDIYESVSNCYCTTVYSVERGITFSIRKAYEKNPAGFQDVFTEIKRPPSNMKFIKMFYIYMQQSGLF